jgi:hypothetical protein
MIKQLLIVSAPKGGFAFSWVQGDDKSTQCFIPAYVAAEAGFALAAGDTVSATIAPNFADKSASTPWQAVKLHSNGVEVQKEVPKIQVEPAPQTQKQIDAARYHLDQRVMDFVSNTAYATTGEIASACHIDQRTAGNSAQRWFNKDKMARADVYRKSGLSKPSFVLYASDAHNFLEQDQ